MTKRKAVYPSNVVHKGIVSEFTEKGAYFEDGSHEDFDEAIFCTGKPIRLTFFKNQNTISCRLPLLLPLFI